MDNTAARSAFQSPSTNLTDLLADKPASPLDLALQIARTGVPVFPVHFRPSKTDPAKVEKLPAVKGWSAGAASTDEAQIRDWWRQWPQAQVGLPTGPLSGLAVLDLDVKGGKDGIAACRARGVDPDTVTPMRARTRSGGLHLYFRHREGLRNVQGADGIDVRGDGGYVVAYAPLHDLNTLPNWPQTFAPVTRQPVEQRAPEDMTAEDWAEVERALSHLSADCPRDDWIKAGMALHHAGGGSEQAFTIWADWSRTALPLNVADDRELAEQWQSFGRRQNAAPVTLGSLFHLAAPHGYERPRLEFDAADFDDLPARSKTNLNELLGVSPAQIGIIRARNGDMKTNLHNAILTLDSVQQERGWTLCRNDMTGHVEWNGRRIENHDLNLIRVAIEQAGLHMVGASAVAEAVDTVGARNQYHPIRDWLRGLQHDGAPRMDSWLSRYLGVEASPYTRAIGRAFLIGMVARVMEPGCKHDCVLVLSGPQGGGKSTACRIIGGDYFGDNMPSIRDGAKEASIYLAGHWLVELAEMAPSRKAEAEDLKAFLTRQVDEVRPVYSRLVQATPRQSVFVGTTNETAFLRDMTGARRFWPVTCGQIDTDALAQDRAQLFAEAYAAYQAGERGFLDADAEGLAREAQEAVREAHPWEAEIADLMEGDGEFVERRTSVSGGEVLGLLGVPVERQTSAQLRQVSSILRKQGWEMKRTSQSRVWVRK